MSHWIQVATKGPIKYESSVLTRDKWGGSSPQVLTSGDYFTSVTSSVMHAPCERIPQLSALPIHALWQKKCTFNKIHSQADLLIHYLNKNCGFRSHLHLIRCHILYVYISGTGCIYVFRILHFVVLLWPRIEMWKPYSNQYISLSISPSRFL